MWRVKKIKLSPHHFPLRALCSSREPSAGLKLRRKSLLEKKIFSDSVHRPKTTKLKETFPHRKAQIARRTPNFMQSADCSAELLALETR